MADKAITADGEIVFLISGGASEFDTLLELTDCPSSYSGQGGKILAVNVGETAVEFIDDPDTTVGLINGIVKADGAGNISAAVEDTDYQGVPAEGAFADGDKTKLDGIEALADVTDFTNVDAALSAATGDIDVNAQAITNTSGVRRTISTYTTTQTLDADDDMVICTTNAFTVTLPAVATTATGKVYDIKNDSGNGTNIITVDANSTEKIDETETVSIVAGNSLRIVNDGSKWHKI